ncbi:MAG: pentapeptide repeat-containing protein [Saccharothrix sp.]|nr:pentapeptide repeat-containing protein [Saccharothrix sp.]
MGNRARRRRTPPDRAVPEGGGAARVGAGRGAARSAVRAGTRRPGQPRAPADRGRRALRLPARPLHPAADKPGAHRLGGLGASLRGPTRRATSTAAVRRATPPAPTPTDEQRRQEREVRFTAQRILTRHLQPGDNPRRPAPTFWAGIDLDLTGATLIDLDLSECHLRTGRFTGATFTGAAGFRRTNFSDQAWSTDTTFGGLAHFHGATFTDSAWFIDASFAGGAWFQGAAFTAGAYFLGATFTDDTRFSEASFAENVWFDGATFAGGTRFHGTTFTGDAVFYEATFTGETGFEDVTFTGGAVFDQARFRAPAAWPGAWFERVADMKGATVRTDLDHDVDSRGTPWPIGWTTADDAVTADLPGRWVHVVPLPAVLPPAPPKRAGGSRTGAASAP